MSQTVLITGGFGYLGGRIAAFLAAAGFHIVIGTRKMRNSPKWLPLCKVVELDLRNSDSIARAVKGSDAVVHLAAMNERECIDDPEAATLVNTLLTQRILLASIAQGVRRFVYMSTAHVYGSPLVGDIDESSLPRPAHLYSITHRGAEDHVLAAHDQRKIDGIVMRLTNGFGYPMHPGIDRWSLLVNDLCKQATIDRRIRLNSTGLQWRDFIPISDVTGAVKHLLSIPEGRLGDGLFNVGCGSSSTVWNMARQIAVRCELALGFVPVLERQAPAKEESHATFRIRTTKILETGFSPLGDADGEIDQTLRLCMKWFAGGA